MAYGKRISLSGTSDNSPYNFFTTPVPDMGISVYPDYSGTLPDTPTFEKAMAAQISASEQVAASLNAEMASYMVADDAQLPTVYQRIAQAAKAEKGKLLSVLDGYMPDYVGTSFATVIPALTNPMRMWMGAVSSNAGATPASALSEWLLNYARKIESTYLRLGNEGARSAYNALMALATAPSLGSMGQAIDALLTRLTVIEDDALTEYENAVWDTKTPQEWEQQAANEWRMAMDGVYSFIYLTVVAVRAISADDAEAMRQAISKVTPPEADPNRVYASAVYEAIRKAAPLVPDLTASFQTRLEDALAPYVVTRNRIDLMTVRSEADVKLMLNIADTINGQGMSDESITAVSALYWLRDNDEASLDKVLKANPDYVNAANAGTPSTPALNGFNQHHLSRAIKQASYFSDAPRAFGGLNGIGKWAKKQIKKLGFLSMFIPGLSLAYMAQKVNNFYQRFEDEIKKLKNVDSWKLILFGGFYLMKAVTKASAATFMEVTTEMLRAVKAVMRYTSPLMIAYYELVPESTRARFSAWEKKHRKAVKIVSAIVATIITLGQAAPQLLQQIGYKLGEAIGAVGNAANLAWDNVVNFVSEKVVEYGLSELSPEQMGEKAYNYAKDEIKQRAQDKLRELGKEGMQNLIADIQGHKKTEQTLTAEVLDLTGTPPVGIPTSAPSINWRFLLPLMGTATFLMGN